MSLLSTLMPREGQFFTLFNDHAALVVQGGRELFELLQEYDNVPGRGARISRIEEIEHKADRVTRDAVELLDQKATREELEDYKKFVLILADRAANARKEGFMGMRGERVSDAEREAIGEIAAALA